MRPKPYDRQVLDEPGRREWKKAHWGPCAVCGEDDQLVRHHCLYEQHLRGQEGLAGAVIWDLRNALNVGMWCKCHARQHSGAQRIPASLLPAAAHEFGIEILGEGRWTLYVARYYRV
jgi:hypothetical protein